MVSCIACERPNATPSSAVPKMCTRCWLAIPNVTRHLYLHGGLSAERLGAIGKERMMSARELTRRRV